MWKQKIDMQNGLAKMQLNSIAGLMKSSPAYMNEACRDFKQTDPAHGMESFSHRPGQSKDSREWSFTTQTAPAVKTVDSKTDAVILTLLCWPVDCLGGHESHSSADFTGGSACPGSVEFEVTGRN